MIARLLNDKVRLFWLLQISGWLAYGLINFLSGYIHGKGVHYLYPTIAYAFTAFILTLCLRYIFRSIWNRPIMLVVSVAIIGTIFAALIFSFFQTLAFEHLYSPIKYSSGFWKYFKDAPFTAYIFISWTGLYFGINYYLMLQEQTSKTLKATALAHQAQLHMLRYQLNPHFLFNTLNAISTLVLEKNINGANDMLTRLSAFLRYSLINQPDQNVSLERELRAMNLYLEIEKVRFQDRLRLNLDIEDRARAALIPSLLMQPLIENAIKYAIAPNENGGTINLSAKITGDKLCIILKDDGPGMSFNSNHRDKNSSGVGLVNTKERLRQLFGDDHQLLVNNIEPHGLMITVYIPCKFANEFTKEYTQGEN